MKAAGIESLIKLIDDALAQQQFVKMTLSKNKIKSSDLKRITLKPVALKAGLRMSFLYNFETRDEVKNHDFESVGTLVKTLLEETFLEANFFTVNQQHTLMHNGKGNAKLVSRKLEQEKTPDLSHDKNKQRLLKPTGLHWQLLGMTNHQGQVLPSMQHKFKQINKYVEILDGLISPWHREGPLRVVDMGAGKAYLTFALYEHLRSNPLVQARVTGVELRPDLVAKTNIIAKQSGFEGLHFEEGSIQAYPMPPTDVLIALHACDTATDDAIAAGIAAGVKLIVCAPCCHKQIRREMQQTGLNIPLVKYGIFMERQAEIITDTLRALIMEKYGYQSHVQEFIEAEHTPKNVLLSGFRTGRDISTAEIEEKIRQIKSTFGIREHFLETALKAKGIQ